LSSVRTMWSTIEAAAAAMAQGNFVVVVDNEDRENEGDLIMAAQFATVEQTAFMVKHTNGILCVPITAARAVELDLPQMIKDNQDRNGTAFSVSCDATVGTTTGASALDRARTTRVLSQPASGPASLNRPGHIFPLVARAGGTCERGGHTEAAVDLCQLGGCRPAGLICELMHPDGTMMRRNACLRFAREHGLEIITTAQIVEFRQTVQGGVSPPRAIATAVDEQRLLQSAADEYYMKVALKLADRGRMSAPPNPWVGCVLVKDDEIIGQGFHHQAGGLHAEPLALADANARHPGAVNGCTAYVTLEPCHHHGKTAPCDQALIAAGVGRVVICLGDPDVRVRGLGVATLMKAGVKTRVGVCEDLGKHSLRSYIRHRCTGRPFVVVKSALTLDGKIACADKTSQWITGPEARADVHLLRARSQAILVGTGTALSDRPRLTTRINGMVDESVDLPPVVPSLRVALDRTGKITSGPLLDTAMAPTLLFTSAATPDATLGLWKKAGVQVCVVPCDGSQRLSLTAVLDELGARGVLQLLVEGGSETHSEFLRARLVDEVHMYKGSTVLGHGGIPWVTADMARTITDANFWNLRSVRHMGNDLCAEYEVSAGSKL